jgi:hypothetical protein
MGRNNSIAQSSIHMPEDDLAEGSTMTNLHGITGVMSDDERFKNMPHSKSVSYLSQTQQSYTNSSMIRQEAKQSIMDGSPLKINAVNEEYLKQGNQ